MPSADRRLITELIYFLSVVNFSGNDNMSRVDATALPYHEGVPLNSALKGINFTYRSTKENVSESVKIPL